MGGPRLLSLVWLAIAAGPAAAQTIVISPAPDRVAITIYRDPQRSAAQAPNLEWLNGYALVSETRQVTLAAGESEIRFEGVAGGILPQSAIVTGLPQGVVERNRDAYLLSPGTLFDRSLGRRVTIRRTSRATGAVTQTQAVIRSGANGAVALQTADGVEALRCTGLPETLVYDGVPAGLSARPTLSVRARSSQPVSATVTLSYLASGFDWQANYIATLAPDGAHVDLFAWLTLASTDETSFVNADTQAVAGNLRREPVEEQPREGGPLTIHCWPRATTSDIPLETLRRSLLGGMRNRFGGGGDDIVVTGTLFSRGESMTSAPIAVVTVTQENLGDVKLYRVPEPVTVAANSQKQVALLTRPGLRIALVYRQSVSSEMAARAPMPATLVLTTHNRVADGLGLPLPAGGLALFGERAGRPILLGQGALGDNAVGEDVEAELGQAPGVTGQIALVRQDRRWTHYRLTASNDRNVPAAYEATFYQRGDELRFERRLGRRFGAPLWAVTIPANGSVTLEYRVRREPPAAPAVDSAQVICPAVVSEWMAP